MRIGDLFGMALAALWQQKSRSVMTTLGVVFGSFVLAASLSIGQGVQDTIERESHRSDFLRKISIHPKWGGTAAARSEAPRVSGTMSEAKRQRLQRAVGEHATGKPVAVTREKLAAIAKMPHVDAVVPAFWQSGFAVLGEQSQSTRMAAAQAEDRDCRRRLVAGRYFETSDERSVVVSEYFLYRWEIVDDAAVQGVVGQKLRFELRSPWQQRGLVIQLARPEGESPTLEETLAIETIKQQLPAALERFNLSPQQTKLLRGLLEGGGETSESVGEDLTIVGVVRAASEEELKEPWDPLRVGADLILPYQTATALYFRQRDTEERGVDRAVVVVDNERNTKEVYQQILAMDLTANTALEYIEQQKLIYLLIFGGMTCVAAVALLVAALGISNTMLMSVLERTREIGIMKAVGAGNAQLQLIFVIEGLLIGSLGGGLGVLVAWAASFPGDAWVRSMVKNSVPVELKDSLFVFPPWLVVVTLAFAVVVTTLAAVYPARRAVRIDPVAALRHE